MHVECQFYQLRGCADVEYKYGHSDDDDDEGDGPAGLPSGVYGRGVQRKHYMSLSSFDNLENVSICIRYF